MGSRDCKTELRSDVRIIVCQTVYVPGNEEVFKRHWVNHRADYQNLLREIVVLTALMKLSQDKELDDEITCYQSGGR